MELVAMRANVVSNFALAMAGVALAEVVILGRCVPSALAVRARFYHIGTSAVTVGARSGELPGQADDARGNHANHRAWI